MCKFYLLIFFIIGANLTTIVQTSAKPSNASGQENMKCICDWHNLSSSFSKMFEHNFDKMQKNLTEWTEQIIDQNFTSISEDLKKSALNMNKLQTSVDQLNEKHKETSSILKTFRHQLDAIQKHFLQMEAQNSTFQNETQNLTGDCTDLFNLGEKVSTSYLLQKYNRTVLCDMKTDGGGWLVIQQRKKVTKQVDFNRTWASYKDGFGDLDTEFWIGNEFLHRITNQKSYELRIDIEDFENGTFYATYSDFRVDNEESGYKLHVGKYEGNLTDNLAYNDEYKFSTSDRDYDPWSEGNCAQLRSGGFWYNYCGGVYLNGMFPTVPVRQNYQLIGWWHNGEYLVLINVQMKIRPIKEQPIAV